LGGTPDATPQRVPEQLFAPAPDTRREPRLVNLNRTLAAALDRDVSSRDAVAPAAVLGGNTGRHGTEPIAMARAGHWFGRFGPRCRLSSFDRPAAR